MTLCPRTLFFSSKSMVAARATVNPFFSAFVVLPLIVFLPILALVPQSGTPEWHMTSVEIILHSLLTLFARCSMQNLSPTEPDVTRTKALFPQQPAKLALSCLLVMGLLSDLLSSKNSKIFWSRSLESETLLLPRRLRFFSLPTLCWNKLSYWLSQSHFWSMWNSLAVLTHFFCFFFVARLQSSTWVLHCRSVFALFSSRYVHLPVLITLRSIKIAIFGNFWRALSLTEMQNIARNGKKVTEVLYSVVDQFFYFHFWQ